MPLPLLVLVSRMFCSSCYSSVAYPAPSAVHLLLLLHIAHSHSYILHAHTSITISNTVSRRDEAVLPHHRARCHLCWLDGTAVGHPLIAVLVHGRAWIAETAKCAVYSTVYVGIKIV